MYEIHHQINNVVCFMVVCNTYFNGLIWNTIEWQNPLYWLSKELTWRVELFVRDMPLAVTCFYFSRRKIKYSRLWVKENFTKSSHVVYFSFFYIFNIYTKGVCNWKCMDINVIPIQLVSNFITSKGMIKRRF